MKRGILLLTPFLLFTSLLLGGTPANRTNVQDDDFEWLTSAEGISVYYDASGQDIRLRFKDVREAQRTVVYETIDPQTVNGVPVYNWTRTRIALGETNEATVTVGPSRGKQAFGGLKDLCFRIRGFWQDGKLEELAAPKKVCIAQREKEVACSRPCDDAYQACKDAVDCPSFTHCHYEECDKKRNECLNKCRN